MTIQTYGTENDDDDDDDDDIFIMSLHHPLLNACPARKRGHTMIVEERL